jgi:hypothetical protein
MGILLEEAFHLHQKLQTFPPCNIQDGVTFAVRELSKSTRPDPAVEQFDLLNGQNGSIITDPCRRNGVWAKGDFHLNYSLIVDKRRA